MIERSRVFLLISGAVVLLVLAAGAGAVYLFREQADSREELAKVYAQQGIFRGDVVAMSERKGLKSGELARKEEELAQGSELLKVEERAPHPALATLPEARDFSARLFSYAAAQELTIESFEQAQQTASVGALEYPAFGYTLAVQGPPAPVIGMLGILQEIGGAKVEALELTRGVDDESPWDMSLSLSVIYATGG